MCRSRSGVGFINVRLRFEKSSPRWRIIERSKILLKEYFLIYNSLKREATVCTKICEESMRFEVVHVLVHILVDQLTRTSRLDWHQLSVESCAQRLVECAKNTSRLI